MRKVKKFTKQIDNLHKKVELLHKKVDLEKAKMDAGKMTKADFHNAKTKIAAKERTIWSQIRHLEKLRVKRERYLKDKQAEKAAEKDKKQEEKDKKAAEEGK